MTATPALNLESETWAGPPPGRAQPPERQVLKLLSEIALAASARGGGEAAAPIFDALTLFTPESPLPAIGRALDEIAVGRHQDAVERLRRAGAGREDSAPQLQAVLLIALSLAGQQVDSALLCRHLLSSESGPASRIATRLQPVIEAGLNPCVREP